MESIISHNTQKLFQTPSAWEIFQKQFWSASPYAHQHIDDFLESHLFQRVGHEFQISLISWRFQTS